MTMTTVNMADSKPQPNDPNELERILGAACGLAAHGDEVRSIQVLTCRRPTYDELVRYRAHADSYGLTMIVLGQGGVAFHRRGAEQTRPIDGPGHENALSRSHGHAEMTEGPR